MGRFTLIILVVLALVAFWFARRTKSSLSNEERDELERLRRLERKHAGKPSASKGEPMEVCAYCGVYFPRKQAIWHEDKAYCSEKCRRYSSH